MGASSLVDRARLAGAGDTAEVLVTVAVPGVYHYRIPPRFTAVARIGARVLVRFGGKQITGVIARTGTPPPAELKKLLDITDVLDDEPALSAELVELCLWIASYYEAPPGEVIKAALPAGSSIKARRLVALTPAGEALLSGAVPAKTRALLGRLEAGPIPTAGMNTTVRKAFAALIEQGLVEELDEREAARTRLKRERVVELAVSIEEARTAAARAPKRLAVVEALAGGARAVHDLGIANASTAIRELEKAKLVRTFEREAALDAAPIGDALKPTTVPTPTDEQAHAIAAIIGSLHERVRGPMSSAASIASAANRTGASANSDATPEMSAEAAAASAGSDAPPGMSAEAAAASAGSDATRTTSADAPAASAESNATPGTSAEATAASAGSDATRMTSADAPAASAGSNATPGTSAEATTDVASTASDPTAATSPKPGTAAASASPARELAPFLLHGVTGSGKTEVYLRVIAEALELGKTALVLVPEISLTPQLAARFRARFGDQVAILHSGMSDQARLGEWSRLRRGQARIAVGARSAIFAPLTDLGVIVVDEEHDSSFKQEEGVRYHARDVALVRAQRAGAVCVLGSATPSLESYHHAERGHYQLLVLTQRPTSQPMPSVEVVDLRTHVPDGEAMLSSPLRQAITETLAAGDQAILFLNRRGFSTFVMCRACGHSFRCVNCSVSYTYHRSTDRLTCHYCGKVERVPERCPECKAHDTIVRKGLGTEKIAESVALEFPKARVARLDRDVASGAKAEAVLSRVARREVDILVGTQMVTKGHDFPGVTLVGVLCADTGLDLPDFRASERTFQLLAQVAGRAGRGERAGRVIVQTYRPGASAVVAAAAHDYLMFFNAESASRADLHYPPHGRLIVIRIDGADENAVAGVARKLAKVGEAVAAHAEIAGTVEVLGPVPAPLERLRNRTRWQVWLRGTDRTALRRVARTIAATEVSTKVRVQLDVDPMSAL